MKAMGVVALVVALSGCGLENRVEVQCLGAGVDYQCSVKHVQGGDPVNACWTVNVECGNGFATSGSACQRVEPSGQASRLIPISAFPNAERCDVVSSLNVAMGEITTVQ